MVGLCGMGLDVGGVCEVGKGVCVGVGVCGFCVGVGVVRAQVCLWCMEGLWILCVAMKCDFSCSVT